jgi:hypothetical protein
MWRADGVVTVMDGRVLTYGETLVVQMLCTALFRHRNQGRDITPRNS